MNSGLSRTSTSSGRLDQGPPHRFQVWTTPPPITLGGTLPENSPISMTVLLIWMKMTLDEYVWTEVIADS